MDVFNDVVNGLDIFQASRGVGVRCGITVKIDEGNRLSVGAWVYLCVLEAAFFVEEGNVFVKSINVGLGYGKGAMGQGGDPFVSGSLGDVVDGAWCGKDWFVGCVVE